LRVRETSCETFSALCRFCTSAHSRAVSPLHVVESRLRGSEASPERRLIIFPRHSVNAGVCESALRAGVWMNGYVTDCVRTSVRAHPRSAR
jgi:hypothetical protein